MPLNNARPGFNSAVEYAVSGVPHVVTGSATTTASVVEFDYVTRAITVTNQATPGSYLLIGFTQNGVNGNNCFPINGGASHRFEIRVRDLWVKGQAGAVGYGVLAELTPIERRQMMPLTGSVDTSTQAGRLMASGSIVWPGIG